MLGEKKKLPILPLVLSKFFFSCVEHYIEEVQTFTGLAKLNIPAIHDHSNKYYQSVNNVICNHIVSPLVNPKIEILSDSNDLQSGKATIVWLISVQ